MNPSQPTPSSESKFCDHRVRELAQLRLMLRSDLHFTAHFEGGQRCYMIEDSARTKFFRVGIAEYLLISMLDGSTTVGDALARQAKLDPEHALTEAEATTICKWLVESELASTSESTDSLRLGKVAKDHLLRKRIGTWNPLCAKIPLAYPDRFFTHVVPWGRHLFGGIAGLISVIVMVIAIHKISLHWDSFTTASGGIFSPGRWIWLGVCWLTLKVFHESAHAIVCRKYGGNVHEAGAIFVLFAPLAYVDLTSSWRFRSKWQRIHTAAAGMYIELVIAAIAAIAWTMTPSGLFSDLCFNVIVMASVTTILFNANPLMRFDGYFILSDLLEIPNLYGDSQQYLQYLGRRYVLGEPAQSALRWSPRDIFIRFFAVAAFLWRILICVSLIVGAAMLFDGLGLILATLALVLWVGVPLFRLAKYIIRRDGSHRQRQLRFVFATTVCGGLIFLAAGLGWPGAQRAEAIVQYEPIAFVRAACPGFVKRILVHVGENVSEGQIIAELENQPLRAELQDLELAIQQSQIKLRVFKQRDEMHDFQAEQEQLRSLEEKRDQKREQVALLTLRASCAGRIVARTLPLKLETYLHEGDHLAAIGNESRKELQIAIPQVELDHFEEQRGHAVDVRMTGGLVMAGQLQQVDPRATMQAPHESMYAALGGALKSRRTTGEDSSNQYELISPHFTGKVPLTEQQSETLRVGQRGVIWFGRYRETIGQVVAQKLREMLPALAIFG